MSGQSDASFPDEIQISEDGETIALDDLLTGRGFVTGKSGSGKSNTASVLAEEILSLGLPLLVVDTDGEYHGLGESFDVVHAGEGEDCDVGLEESDGRELAELALDENTPVILDLSGFVDPDRATAVVEAVLRELFAMEADRQKPFLVFVEEVHEYLPQQGGLDELGTLLLQIAKRGRKRGLGLCGLSQRPAAVDKEFITQCDWFVWHRLTWESDVDVVRRFLDADRAAQVGDLAAGEAFVVTDWDEDVRRVQFRRKRTPDAGATPSITDMAGGDAPESSPSGDAGATDGGGSNAAATGGQSTDHAAAGDADAGESTPTADPHESVVAEVAELLAYAVRRVVRGVRRAVAGVANRVR